MQNVTAAVILWKITLIAVEAKQDWEILDEPISVWLQMLLNICKM